MNSLPNICTKTISIHSKDKSYLSLFQEYLWILFIIFLSGGSSVVNVYKLKFWDSHHEIFAFDEPRIQIPKMRITPWIHFTAAHHAKDQNKGLQGLLLIAISVRTCLTNQTLTTFDFKTIDFDTPTSHPLTGHIQEVFSSTSLEFI